MASETGRRGRGGEIGRPAPCVSVCRSLASSMGRMELSRVETRAASRLHMAPNTLRSSSRRDTRCSCTVTHTHGGAKALLHLPNSTAALQTRLRCAFNILPSGNRRPGTARSRSGWPCTSSCTPLGPRRSEEDTTRTLALTATLNSLPVWSSQKQDDSGLRGARGKKPPLWRSRP